MNNTVEKLVRCNFSKGTPPHPCVLAAAVKTVLLPLMSLLSSVFLVVGAGIASAAGFDAVAVTAIAVAAAVIVAVAAAAAQFIQ